ncbi:DUF6434 domain-containing protein [Spirosoma pollinicola]|uniref:DUF6434 domain-containing protein n=1 Tax=Spirosoma pollinicola TaxID=2057025 RepID=UPI00374491A1
MTPIRCFFKSVIGTHFHFTVGLMKFCKENPTKTFRNAVQDFSYICFKKWAFNWMVCFDTCQLQIVTY